MSNFNFNKIMVELDICGEPFIATIDMKTVIHYKTKNKKPFLASMQGIGDLDEVEIIKLLGSVIRKDEKSDPVGYEFFKEFNPLAVVENLTPILVTVMGGNMPEAENEEEKK